MPPRTTIYGMSENAEAIRQTIGARLRVHYDASAAQALPANIDKLLQRLILQRLTEEGDETRDSD